MPGFIVPAGMALAIERGWFAMHECGTFVRFTPAGAALFAQISRLHRDDPA
jgi:hypothetical protein